MTLACLIVASGAGYVLVVALIGRVLKFVSHPPTGPETDQPRRDLDANATRGSANFNRHLPVTVEASCAKARPSHGSIS